MFIGKSSYVGMYAGRDWAVGWDYWTVSVYWKPVVYPSEGQSRWEHCVEVRVRLPEFKVTRR